MRIKYSVNSISETSTDSVLTTSSSKKSCLNICRVSRSTSARCSASSRRPSRSRCALISSSTNFSGTGISNSDTNLSTSLSRACAPCSIAFTRSKRVFKSALSSSKVSNSEASFANASSSAGSSRSLTAFTVTVTEPFSPSCIPRSEVSKTFDSPALKPTTASSNPSTMLFEPTS